ncbi:hypothetical protein EDD85DRAFT_922472 [Armillaria nabsnona]|nr:hypothetical protein EDD85DRAFT_922472 [Armillaria nabsnona]
MSPQHSIFRPRGDGEAPAENYHVLAQTIALSAEEVVIVGDLTTEWCFHSTSSVIEKPADIAQIWRVRDTGDATPEEYAKTFGRMTSDYQVHLPVRILARDLHDAGFTVLRYEVRWTPEQNKTNEIARAWIRRVDEEWTVLERAGKSSRANNEVFALCEDRSVKWVGDGKWAEKMSPLITLPGEV